MAQIDAWIAARFREQAEHIRQLEMKIFLWDAQAVGSQGDIDRMRPVVEAAVEYARDSLSHPGALERDPSQTDDRAAKFLALLNAVHDYTAIDEMRAEILERFDSLG